MLPAQERFEAARLSARQIDDRLEDEMELFVGERQRQVVLELAPEVRDLAQIRRENHMLGAARALGGVERDVGILQKTGEVERLPLALESDAEADADEDLLAVEDEGGRQGARQPRGAVPRPRLGVGATDEDGELVSSEARHEGVLACGYLQPVADLAQDAVAARMSVAVVDVLEVVEVEEDQGMVLIRIELVGLCMKRRAVRQAGQPVALRRDVEFAGLLVHEGEERDPEEDETDDEDADRVEDPDEVPLIPGDDIACNRIGERGEARKIAVEGRKGCEDLPPDGRIAGLGDERLDRRHRLDEGCDFPTARSDGVLSGELGPEQDRRACLHDRVAQGHVRRACGCAWNELAGDGQLQAQSFRLCLGQVERPVVARRLDHVALEAQGKDREGNRRHREERRDEHEQRDQLGPPQVPGGVQPRQESSIRHSCQTARLK